MGVNWTDSEYKEYMDRHELWSDGEIAKLRDYYRNTPDDKFDLSILAASLRRNVNAITLKAGRLKLTSIHRKSTAATKAKMSVSQKAAHGTPEAIAASSSRMKAMRGQLSAFKGHRHTDATKAVLSAKTKAMWAKPEAFHNQPEYRQSLSDRLSRRVREPERTFTRAAGRRRVDLDNRYFRSSWEANYARYLNFLIAHKDIFKWEYEPDTFYFEKIKRGSRSYTPDFKIWRTEGAEPHYEEIKGWFDPRSKTKMKRMAKYYPDVKVVLIDQGAYYAIAKSVRAFIPGWESQKR